MRASGITFAADAEEEVISFQERALKKFVKDVQDKKVGPLPFWRMTLFLLQQGLMPSADPNTPVANVL